jgi:hypothetical protein
VLVMRRRGGVWFPAIFCIEKVTNVCSVIFFVLKLFFEG